jgi:hypothetical protein
MEPKRETLYVVEVGSADFHFEKLQDAADFFSMITKAPIKHVVSTYENGKSLSYLDQDHPIRVSMKQESITIYPSLKAAKFAANDNSKE